MAGDPRPDIFSFGSVLYEMLTGQRAFQGDTNASTIAAILRDEPRPVSAITPSIPVELERLINRCLRKDPQRRWQSVADLKVALNELKEDSDSGRPQTASAGAKQARPWRSVIGAVAVVALVAVAGWYWLARQRSVQPEAALIPVPLTTYPDGENHPSFSPDGTQIAFGLCASGNCDICIQEDESGSDLMLVENFR